MPETIIDSIKELNWHTQWFMKQVVHNSLDTESKFS
jgi:hypothetical protein